VFCRYSDRATHAPPLCAAVRATMRKDSYGFFWQDLPLEPYVPKEVVKCTPPAPVWLDHEAEIDPDNYELATLDELLTNEWVAIDIEIYPNYFLVCMMGFEDGKVYYLEATPSDPFAGEKRTILWHILRKVTTLSFNGLKFDLPIIELALAGRDVYKLKEVADRIIIWNERFYCRHVYDHIDLIEVAPLVGSLKAYAGRLHTKRMQDLPYDPATILTQEQMIAVRHYCVNDLRNTCLLARCLSEQIELRYTISNQYLIDVRSKSDAQIAERIILHEMKRSHTQQISIPPIEAGKLFFYKAPGYISFHSPELQAMVHHIARTPFQTDYVGKIHTELGSPKVMVGGKSYSMGVGGLHSSEQKVFHYANDDWMIIDADVTSYYPFITLNMGLFPLQLGPKFVDVLRHIVELRINAKRAGNKAMADTYKIVVNGAFGKYGSPHSILYAPNLLIQVTLTGQLSLLMLIESLERQGIQVLSANTDGMTVRCRRSDKHLFDNILSTWQGITGFEIEQTIYRALFSKDVNNYIALKEDRTFKTKGAYASPPLGSAESLHKNPVTLICIEAVKAFLLTGKPLAKSITECQDIRQFIVVRTVRGGAVQIEPDVHYIGKVARWYYARGRAASFVYASSGRKVPKSAGARPLMELPDVMPNDIDYDWYLTEANRILCDIGLKDFANEYGTAGSAFQ
jgi:hypothetical protein